MYDPKKDLITNCLGCNKIMLIENYDEPLNQYLIDLGFKKTNKYWHSICWWTKYLEI